MGSSYPPVSVARPGNPKGATPGQTSGGGYWKNGKHHFYAAKNPQPAPLYKGVPIHTPPVYGDPPMGGLAAFTGGNKRGPNGEIMGPIHPMDPLFGEYNAQGALGRFLAAKSAQQYYAGRTPHPGAPGQGGGGAVVDPFAQANQAALAEIAAAKAQWDARNAGLKTDETARNASTLAGLQAGSQAQLTAYKAALDPIRADLQAQGFSSAPIQQRAAIDEQRLLGDQARNSTLSTRFSEIEKRGFADREAAAGAHTNASQMNLAQQIAALRAEAAANAAGGGGGGGGGGGDPYFTAGDANLVAEGSGDERTDWRRVQMGGYTGLHKAALSDFMYGGGGGSTGHVRPGLLNVGSQEDAFAEFARKQGWAKNGFLHQVRKQVWKPLKKNIGKAQQEKRKSISSAHQAMLRGHG